VLDEELGAEGLVDELADEVVDELVDEVVDELTLVLELACELLAGRDTAPAAGLASRRPVPVDEALVLVVVDVAVRFDDAPLVVSVLLWLRPSQPTMAVIATVAPTATRAVTILTRPSAAVRS
jgi:hypothetical protein